jgi:hypothetical protein
MNKNDGHVVFMLLLKKIKKISQPEAFMGHINFYSPTYFHMLGFIPMYTYARLLENTSNFIGKLLPMFMCECVSVCKASAATTNACDKDIRNPFRLVDKMDKLKRSRRRRMINCYARRWDHEI